jgi:hypothetical protein
MAGAVAFVPSTSPTPVAAAGDLGAGGEFHPLTPTRIFDTRDPSINDVAPLGKKPTSTALPTFDIELLGRGGVPTDANSVLAVVASFTVVEATASGWLGAYPTGSPPSQPTSILNFANGAPVPNLAIVRPGAGGKLTLQAQSNPAGAVHVLVDVFGWISSSSHATRGSRLVSQAPVRVVDTRTTSTTLGPKGVLTVPVRGAVALEGGALVVPNDTDVSGVLLNVTGITPTLGTYISAVPEAPTVDPATSNLNLSAGQIKANLVAVPVGADGNVRLFNYAGSVDVAVDVVGYFLAGESSSTRAGRLVPLAAPYRVFDTREAQFGNVALGPKQVEDWSFSAFANSVTIFDSTAGANVSAGKQAGVVGNLTAVPLVRQYPTVPVAGFLSAYPNNAATRPVVSNLNTVETMAVPNLALLSYSPTTEVRVYNHSGYAHYLFDVFAIILAD